MIATTADQIHNAIASTMNDVEGAAAVLPVNINPQMAAEVETSSAAAAAAVAVQPKSHAVQGQPLLKFALLLQTVENISDEAAISSVSHPISLCNVVMLVILGESERDPEVSVTTKPSTTKTGEKEARQWLKKSQVANYDQVQVLFGEQGFQQMLHSSDDNQIDAVYVLAQSCNVQQHECVMACLQARKHVLLQDRTSQPLPDFTQQFQCAKANQRFLQSSTMFLYHHRVFSFLDCVLNDKFGEIDFMNAKFVINYDDVARVGVTQLPLPPDITAYTDGCIRKLARYCVLISVMLLNRAGTCTPVSAKIEGMSSSKDQNYVTTGYVLFNTSTSTNNDSDNENHHQCKLYFNVGFTNLALTRQIFEVQSHDRYATMTDFVIPHPDGLANYRIYDKAYNPKTKKLEIVKGEALDVLSGPPQGVMMWRRFAQLAQTIEGSPTQKGYNDPQAQPAFKLANIAIQTKQILLALLESAESNQEVPVEHVTLV